MGWFSSMFVLTMARDAGLLLTWLVTALGGWSIDWPRGQAWSAAAVPLLATLISLIGFLNARRTASVVRVDVPIRDLPAGAGTASRSPSSATSMSGRPSGAATSSASSTRSTRWAPT